MQHAGSYAGAVHTLVVWAVLSSTGGRGIDECIRISAVCRRELLGRDSGALIAARSKVKARPNNLSRRSKRRDDILSSNVSRKIKRLC